MMAKKSKNPPKSDFRIRCRKLGHQISFVYCRKENNGLPCPKTLDCWHYYFFVEDFFKKELTDKQWEESFVNPAKPKIQTLLDLIENAKKNKELKGS
jgi:hypothetical protein